MLTLSSPAKVNLFLRVLKKRPDGYHEIASLMQAISLFDTIHYTFSETDSLTCTDPSIPVDKSNLIIKAADLFRKKTSLKFGLKVHLEKRIPSQAGLGGGSGNAATTLWALNQLCRQPASEEELALWSSEIGSDIPFFFSTGTAYSTGRGELIKPLKPISSSQLWIYKPSEGLSTPEVYKNLNVSDLQSRDPELYLEQIILGKENYFNDLEVPAFRLLPSLEKFKQKLVNLGFSNVIMSGSGSAFFCCGSPKFSSYLENTFSYSACFVSRSIGCWFQADKI